MPGEWKNDCKESFVHLYNSFELRLGGRMLAGASLPSRAAIRPTSAMRGAGISARGPCDRWSEDAAWRAAAF
jgi:hypothetical protein